MRVDNRRGETFYELKQAQEEARLGLNKPRRRVNPTVGRLVRIIGICCFGALLLWLLKRADVPPMFSIGAMVVVGLVVLGDVLRLLFDPS